MTPLERRDKALRRFALSLSAFTVAGALLLGFEDSWAQPVVALAVAYPLELALETLDAWAQRRRPRYRGGPRVLFHHLLPAHITALSIALLLYANARLLPIVFATVVAIASKFLIRVRVGAGTRHVLNPSNVGISVTLLAFPWVGISPPYQFTENIAGAWDWLLPVGVLASGTLLNAKLTGKLPLVLAWTGAFAAQGLARAALFGTPLVAPLLPMTGLVFVLYTNYMITDPGTTPVSRRGQIAFGAATAAVYGVLVVEHVVFGLFFALTITCAARGLGLSLLALRGLQPARKPVPVPARTAP